MRIEAEDNPTAGARYKFTVLEAIGGAGIKVFVDQLEILDEDCPDPPCHEIITIPEGTRGATLRIIARDRVGNVTEREFEIAEPYSESGAATAA